MVGVLASAALISPTGSHSATPKPASARPRRISRIVALTAAAVLTSHSFTTMQAPTSVSSRGSEPVAAAACSPSDSAPPEPAGGEPSSRGSAHRYLLHHGPARLDDRIRWRDALVRGSSTGR